MDDLTELKRWVAHLQEHGEHRHVYDYPLDETVTEPSEQAQDPQKRERERAVLSEALSTPWTSALDFGCGVGANFDLFAASSGRADNGFLLGLDPDAARAERARERLDEIALSGVVLPAGIDAIETGPAGAGFDAILACQVLGHTPRAVTERIVEGLLERLNENGRLMLAVPVVFPAVTGLEFAAGHEGESDLFHIVRPALSPHDRSFRTLISATAFDNAAHDPEAGELPVRAFGAPQVEADLNALPHTLRAGPPALGRLFGANRGVRSQLYSIHAFEPKSGLPAIGDVLITVRRD